jgi:hypothetical protein
MRWARPRRRKHSDRDETPAPREHRKLWAEVALPPPPEPPLEPPFETQRWSPVSEPVTDVFPPAAVGNISRVRLGFADGTSVEVDRGSDDSSELIATASRIFGLNDN